MNNPFLLAVLFFQNVFTDSNNFHKNFLLTGTFVDVISTFCCSLQENTALHCHIDNVTAAKRTQ